MEDCLEFLSVFLGICLFGWFIYFTSENANCDTHCRWCVGGQKNNT